MCVPGVSIYIVYLDLIDGASKPYPKSMLPLARLLPNPPTRKPSPLSCLLLGPEPRLDDVVDFNAEDAVNTSVRKFQPYCDTHYVS